MVNSPASPWFPWNMPFHVVGASWYPVPPSGLTAGSWAVAAGLFLGGLALLVWRMDQTDCVG
jgi:hypothetical protein